MAQVGSPTGDWVASSAAALQSAEVFHGPHFHMFHGLTRNGARGSILGKLRCEFIMQRPVRFSRQAIQHIESKQLTMQLSISVLNDQ